MFCVIPSITLGQFWWNVVCRFLDKFAEKGCKIFPPYLNYVSTLPCETKLKCSSRMCYHRAVIERNSRIYLTLAVASNSPDLNPVDKHVEENACKTLITDLELSMTPLTNGCCNDDIIQLGPIRSQSLFQFVQISYAYFIHLLFNSPHTL